MVKIEKGIPVPDTERGNFAGYEGGTKAHSYLHDMEVGDSIRFDSQREVSKVIHAYNRLKKSGHLPSGYTLVQRTMTENQVKFIRIFRTQ